MPTVTVAEAQTQLATLIAQIGDGENVVITQNDKPVAQLVSVEAQKPRRKAGRRKACLDSA